MKKALIFVGLILLLSFSYAQQSLFELAFDAPLAETEAMLKGKGFIEINRASDSITYSSDSLDNLQQLEIRLNDEKDKIRGWELRYDLSQYPETEDEVVAELTALHGEYQVYDDYDYDYIWYFENDKALYISVYPGDRMVLFYTNGNWDDDDYYYYGW